MLNIRRLIVILVVGVVLLVGIIAALVILGSTNDDDSPIIIQSTPGSDYRTAMFDEPYAVDDFSLPSTTGEDFTLSAQKGKVTLLYFGYLTCPDICPTTMAEMVRVYRELGDDTANVTMAMVTVDPDRDSLEKMQTYLNAFDDRFIGVRGDEDALQPVMNEFGVQAIKREVDSALGYLVDHTASVYMIDPNGNLVGRFPYETPYQDIAHDVKVALNT